MSIVPFTNEILPKIHVREPGTLLDGNNTHVLEAEEQRKRHAYLIDVQKDELQKMFRTVEHYEIEVVLSRVALLNNLNMDQLRCLRLAASSLHQQTFFIISGEAGTGKSTTLNAIRDLFELLDESSKLRISATTGTSSAKLFAKTIHSLTGWKYGRNEMNDEHSFAINQLKTVLGSSLKLLLIDEFSMLDARLLWRVHQVLCTVMSNYRDPFGGVSVGFSGDFYQLPPVAGYSLFKVQNKHTDIPQDAAQGIQLWRNVKNVVILQNNYRQEDSRYLELLRHWKHGEMTYEDWSLLKSRVLGNLHIQDTFSEADINVIVKFNCTRNAINEAIVIKFTRDDGCPRVVVECDAKDSCLTGDLDQIRHELLSWNDGRSKYIPGKLYLFIGCKIIVVHNYDTERGIAKGTKGVISAINAEDVVIRTDFNVFTSEEAMSKNIQRNEYRLTKIDTSFKLGVHTVKRNQYGFDTGYCVTDYKSQGDTLSTAFVDINTDKNVKNYYSIYVMLSRVRTLKGLYILSDFNPDRLVFKPPLELQQEMARLKGLADATTKRFDPLIE